MVWVVGDVPSGLFGRSALHMNAVRADKKGSVFRIGGWSLKDIDPRGTWRLRSWATAKARPAEYDGLDASGRETRRPHGSVEGAN